MDDTLKVIYVAASLEQARIMQSALDEEGIQAAVDNERCKPAWASCRWAGPPLHGSWSASEMPRGQG